MTTVESFDTSDEVLRIADLPRPQDGLANYKEQSFEPISVYDKHQEALFIIGMEQFGHILEVADRVLATQEPQELDQEATFDEDDLILLKQVLEFDEEEDLGAIELAQQAAQKYERQRNQLLRQKIEFEIARNNPTVIPSLVNLVSSFNTKLDLFETAIKATESDASLVVLMSLGDLRDEAEQSGDLNNLASYLLREVRCGMGLMANADALTVLARDDRVVMSVGGLWRALVPNIKGLVDDGDYDQAIALASITGIEDYVTETAARVMIDKNRKSPPAYTRQVRKEINALHRVLKEQQNKATEDEQYQAAKLATPLYICFPDAFERLISSKYSYRIESLIGRYGGDDPQKPVLQQVFRLMRKEIGDTWYPTVDNEPSVTEPEADYAKSLKSIEPTKIVELYGKAASLALKVDDLSQIGVESTHEIAAGIDTMRTEWARRRLYLMSDPVDQSRFRTEFLNHFNTILGQIKALPYASQRFDFLIGMNDLLTENSLKADSQLRDQIRTTAQQCLANPIERLGIDESEVRHQCQRLGIELE